MLGVYGPLHPRGGHVLGLQGHRRIRPVSVQQILAAAVDDQSDGRRSPNVRPGTS